MNRFDCRVYVLSLPYQFCFGGLIVFLCGSIKIVKNPQTNNSYSLISQENSYLFLKHLAEGLSCHKSKEGNPFTFGSPSLTFSGERGIRTPGTSQYNGFQDRRDRPLCHLSKTSFQKCSFSKAMQRYDFFLNLQAFSKFFLW